MKYLIRFDQLGSSYLVILMLLLIAGIGGVLAWAGVIRIAVTFFAGLVRGGIRQGFELWRKCLSWASWQTFLVIVIASLFVGWAASRSVPYATILCSLVPLFMGATACMAYMMIDVERYAVSRGYKAVHNPLQGQELAVNLVKYGQLVGVPLLVSAAFGMVAGFALLNLGLFQTIGRTWFIVAEGEADPTYVDFFANALIVLFRIVDVLDFAKSSQLLEVAYVHQARGPASALLAVFRSFFTLVLLQQVFASVRQGQVLSETITDLWNPNEPIQERAYNALPQHGPGAIGPLLVSLGKVTSLTKERRERLPSILAEIGPAAIPALVRHLQDPHEHVRAVSAAALGQLRVHGTIVVLIPLSRDPSDIVRQCLTEALGMIASSGPITREAKLAIVAHRYRFLRSFSLANSLIRVPVVDPIKLAVQTLQAALTDNSLSVRANAARALGRIGPSAAVAAPALIELLKDEDETVRKEAIEAVGKVGGPANLIVESLMTILRDPNPELRAAAARELGAMGTAASEALPALAPLIQDRDDEVRDAAAEAIGQGATLDDDAMREILGGLASPDSIVRAQTAEGLGTIGEKARDTAPALVDSLNDQNDSVRAKAVEALGKIGETAADVAVPGLVRALDDQDNIVSSLAAEALGQMGKSADAAIPSLIRSLKHINADVRASAAESLGKLGVDAAGAVQALERTCLDDDPDVRCQSLRALIQIEQPTPASPPAPDNSPESSDGLPADATKPVPILFTPSPPTRRLILSHLNDTDARVRTTALEAISRYSECDPDVVSVILPLLEDPNEQVRALATTVLPHLAGPIPAVVEGLCTRLREDTDVVQAHAAKALGEFGPAAVAAAETLLHAAKTGEATVRQRAIEAIKSIHPSQTLAERESSEISPEIVQALIEIENAIDSKPEELKLDEIPIVVITSTDPTTGQEIDDAVAVAIVRTEEANGGKKPTDETEFD